MTFFAELGNQVRLGGERDSAKFEGFMVHYEWWRPCIEPVCWAKHPGCAVFHL